MDAAPQLLLELPADPSCLKAVRTRTRAWLVAAGWPDEDADDIVYAVSEAASNAIEHAYPPGPRPLGRNGRGPELRITGTVLGDASNGFCVEVRVRDHGRWRPSPADPGHRGRGLAVMRSSLASVTIRTGRAGTEVVLVSLRLARLRPDRVPGPSRRSPAPMAVAEVEVVVPAASARTAAWRDAHRQHHRRVRLALARAAEAQRRSTENLRLAEELVAAAQQRRIRAAGTGAGGDRTPVAAGPTR